MEITSGIRELREHALVLARAEMESRLSVKHTKETIAESQQQCERLQRQVKEQQTIQAQVQKQHQQSIQLLQNMMEKLLGRFIAS